MAGSKSSRFLHFPYYVDQIDHVAERYTKCVQRERNKGNCDAFYRELMRINARDLESEIRISLFFSSLRFLSLSLSSADTLKYANDGP